MKKIHTVVGIALVAGAILGATLLYFMVGQLKYPLDQGTKDILRREVRQIMDDEIFDVFAHKVFLWQTFFESIDGYDKTAGVAISAGSDDVEMTTAASLNSERTLMKQASWQGMLTFYDRSMMRSSFNLNSVTQVTAYITTGNVHGGGQGYGFKVVNNTLYGVVHNGSAETTLQLMTIDTSNYNLKAVLLPGEKVIFTVEDTERGVLTTGLPTGLSSSTPALHTTVMKMSVKTTDSDAKILSTSFFQYIQYRNRKAAR